MQYQANGQLSKKGEGENVTTDVKWSDSHISDSEDTLLTEKVVNPQPASPFSFISSLVSLMAFVAKELFGLFFGKCSGRNVNLSSLGNNLKSWSSWIIGTTFGFVLLVGAEIIGYLVHIASMPFRFDILLSIYSVK